ncbi:molybdopterin-guanine dinucleotide biosynthesis protein B [Pseudoduganella sp. UC29_106]|uniref:molybdopterin-guanine dinucleotide biosynthesis protein B n=1 Tax=Pseudoduganella sp. UC29_106 TaxID=3374553 RepID=UPI003756740A
MSGARTRVLGVVGTSGSGKTTLLEYLVARLAEEGVKVNVIKHSHHDFELEPPRKDSARFRQAGAAEVMIASPYRFAIIHELRNHPEPTMDEQLARLAPADLTLVEGFHGWPIPKIEVYRREVGEGPRYGSDNSIVAVASDQPRPADAREGLNWLDLNQPEAVLTWLKNFALKG